MSIYSMTLLVQMTVSQMDRATGTNAACTNEVSLPTIRFGQSVPLTGNDALDGMLYRDGIRAAFQEFNDDHRPDKRFKLELQVKDDVGDPLTAKANVEQFVADSSIIGIIGLLGTTSAELASLVAFAAGMHLFGPGRVLARHSCD